MSSNILVIIVIIYALLSQGFTIYAVKFGLKCAEKPGKVMEEPVFNLPKRKKEAKISESDQRVLDILSNIDAYDGTDTGQKEIK